MRQGRELSKREIFADDVVHTEMSELLEHRELGIDVGKCASGMLKKVSEIDEQLAQRQLFDNREHRWMRIVQCKLADPSAERKNALQDIRGKQYKHDLHMFRPSRCLLQTNSRRGDGLEILGEFVPSPGVASSGMPGSPFFLSRASSRRREPKNLVTRNDALFVVPVKMHSALRESFDFCGNSLASLALQMPLSHPADGLELPKPPDGRQYHTSCVELMACPVNFRPIGTIYVRDSSFHCPYDPRADPSHTRFKSGSFTERA
ncbi:hypothetical protein C8J57DRAFT_1721323 [Mycena rebaudengoi]|nr:hypothetical protein C8J57DRAFT_1721323 [Mycena rebaudengoi]